MNPERIIDNLLERIKGLTKENAFLVARIQEIESAQEEMKTAPVKECEDNV